ncbi:MAG: hypothetical protein OHK0046_47200 [Anaerolineae bacterium]
MVGIYLIDYSATLLVLRTSKQKKIDYCACLIGWHSCYRTEELTITAITT